MPKQGAFDPRRRNKRNNDRARVVRLAMVEELARRLEQASKRKEAEHA